jgi:hypothetical protein
MQTLKAGPEMANYFTTYQPRIISVEIMSSSPNLGIDSKKG